jgi:hypothetical protein
MNQYVVFGHDFILPVAENTHCNITFYVLYRYPPRSGIHSGGGPISPTISKARRILHETTTSKAPSHDSRNVRFHLANDNGSTDYDTNPGPESTVTMPSLCSSSNADADISPDPDKLFVPPQKAPTVQEATMEHFKRRLHMRHSLETLKMAPYKVLLDENKAAKSYPDPVVVKYGDFEREKTWLPAIYRSKTMLTPNALQNGNGNGNGNGLPEPPSKFHSRSDTFLAKARGTSAATANGHRLRTPNLSAKARKTTFSIDTSTPGKSHNDQQSLASRNSAKSGHSRPATTKSAAPTIKTRPVTHAMLKREKTELSDKLGSFLNKLEEEKRQNLRHAKGLHAVENSTPMQSAHGRHPNQLKPKAFPPALTSNQTNTVPKSKPQSKSNTNSNQNPRITLNDKPLTIPNSSTSPSTATTTSSSPRTSGSESSPRAGRGIPVYAARRSQRHTATEKLRRVVAALVAGRSKAESMHLDNIRQGQGELTKREESDDEGNAEGESTT